MTSLDALYIALAVGFLAFVAFLSFTLYQMGQTLAALRQVIADVEDIVKDIRALKNGLKYGLWGLLGRILGVYSKGGGDDGRRR